MATVKDTLLSFKSSEPTNNIVVVLNTDSTVWLGIGTNTPAYALDVRGTSSLTGVMAHTYNVPTSASASQDVNSFSTQMPTLTSQFGASNSEFFRAYAFGIVSDTTSNGYGGIMNALIARMDMYTVGATWSKVEAIAGVINTKSSMTGTVSDGYGTSGEILHAGTSTMTTIRGLSGNIQITAAGNIGTGYGTDSVITTTLGQTGTVTTKAVGARSYVQVNNTAAIQWVIGAENFIDLVAAGTVTTDAVGAYNYIQNTGAMTVSGNTYGSRDQVSVTGALVTTGVIYGTFAQLTFATSSTAVGGATNAALNAEIQNSMASTTTNAIIGVNVRWRVNNASLTQTLAIGINVMAPNLTASSVTTTGYGVRINDQSTATGTVTTSYGLRIENQAAASANAYALFVAGGRVQMSSTNGSALFTSASQALTVSTTTSGLLSLTSAGQLNLSAVGGTVVKNTPQAINSTNTATAAQAASGYITSTSAAPTTITLPTGSALGTQLAATQGTIFDLTIDNTAGSNTVTIAVAVNGILSADAVANAASAGLLTVPSGVTGQGTFRLMFSSATAYTFSRIA